AQRARLLETETQPVVEVVTLPPEPPVELLELLEAPQVEGCAQPSHGVLGQQLDVLEAHPTAAIEPVQELTLPALGEEESRSQTGCRPQVRRSRSTGQEPLERRRPAAQRLPSLSDHLELLGQWTRQELIDARVLGGLPVPERLPRTDDGLRVLWVTTETLDA